MNALAILNREQRELSLAIDQACASLQSLKADIHPARLSEIGLQAESAQLYVSYAADMLPVFAELLLHAIDTAAALAEHKILPSDRADIQTFDAIKDVLNDISASADSLVDEDTSRDWRRQHTA